MASGAAKVLKMIEENEIEYVDLRFTDPKGKWQHLSMVASVIDPTASCSTARPSPAGRRSTRAT
jgi:glutamine synthetase